MESRAKDLLYGAPAIAEYLGISERQLEYLRAAGEIEQTRLPNTRKRLYDILDLDEFVEQVKLKLKSV